MARNQALHSWTHDALPALQVLDHEGLQGLKEMHTEIQLLAGGWGDMWALG